MKTKLPDVVIWGRKLSMCDGKWIPLSDERSFAARERWRKDGWKDVHALPKGERPKD